MSELPQSSKLQADPVERKVSRSPNGALTTKSRLFHLCCSKVAAQTSLEPPGSDASTAAEPSRHLRKDQESTAVLSAVSLEELVRRAEDLSESISATSRLGGDGVPASSAAYTPVVAAAARGFTTLLLAARNAQAACVPGNETFSCVPLQTAMEAARALAHLVAVGRQQRPGALLAPLPSESSAVGAAAA